jgi:hypothetical protein
MAEWVAFCPESFAEFFERSRLPCIGVYFYDAAHDYRAQLLGLLFARPFLADRAVLIVGDSNESAVQQANRDFLATHAEGRLLLNLPTPGNGHPSFWNGLQVLAWDRARQREDEPSGFTGYANNFGPGSWVFSKG